jgi:hypothetical protein
LRFQPQSSPNRQPPAASATGEIGTAASPSQAADPAIAALRRLHGDIASNEMFLSRIRAHQPVGYEAYNGQPAPARDDHQPSRGQSAHFFL